MRTKSAGIGIGISVGVLAGCIMTISHGATNSDVLFRNKDVAVENLRGHVAKRDERLVQIDRELVECTRVRDTDICIIAARTKRAEVEKTIQNASTDVTRTERHIVIHSLGQIGAIVLFVFAMFGLISANRSGEVDNDVKKS